MNDQTSLIDSILQEYPMGDDSFLKTITKLLQYYREKKNMLQILLGKYGDVHLEYDMLSFFAQRVISSFAPDGQASQEILQEYIYAATGLLWTHLLLDYAGVSRAAGNTRQAYCETY